MLTLTSKPGTDWPKVMRSFQHMVKYLRKRSPELEYAACKEAGSENGMLHLHVILLGFNYTSHHVISRRWRELTGAHVVRVERLRTDRAHYYVAKYVSKDLNQARKHVTFSRGFPPLPKSDLHFTHLKELDVCGPSKVTVWTSRPAIVDNLVAGCLCFGEPHGVTMEEHNWLRFLPVRSPPVSAAN